MKNKIKTIAFDADDTLWVNETYFQNVEKQFCTILKDYLPQDAVSQELFKTEMANLHLYGFGVKGYVLSMIETACKISQNSLPLGCIQELITMGQDLLQKPIELLDGVVDTLEQLKGKYRLIVATKGDLIDQERKLNRSGLKNYFDHIEIMSDKKVNDYATLLNRLDCKPKNFLMLGNSINSDILPVLELGGFAGHIPFHVTWTHEQNENQLQHLNFIELERIDGVLKYL